MKRILFISLTLVICVSILASIAFATDITLSNYQLSSEVNGGVTYVTAGDSPLADGWIESLGDFEVSFDGNSITLHSQELEWCDGQMQLSWFPFGAGNLIPVSQFKAGYPINFSWGGSIIYKDCQVQRVETIIKIETYNANRRWIGTIDVSMNSDETWSYIPNWSNECAYIVIAYYQVNNISSIGSGAYLTFSSGYEGGSSISFAVPNGTDDILGVLTGEPGDPILPAGSGGIDDLENAEQNLISGSDDAIDDIQNLQQTTLDFFTGFAGTFAFCSALLSLIFGHIGVISSLWYISLAFGIFASIVNIISVGISASDRRKAKQEHNAKHSNKKGG